MLYFVSDITGGADLKQDVNIDDIELAEQRCCYRYVESGCCVEFTQLPSIIMQEQNLDMPDTAEDAVSLYSCLLYTSPSPRD